MTLDTGKNIVLVSNREPYIHEKDRGAWRCRKGIGGLVSALDPVMQSRGRLWIAWGSGSADFHACDEEAKIKVPPNNPKYILKRIKLSGTEINNYYRGFCNSILWPLCHRFVEKASFRPEYWKTYLKINQKFAEAVIEEQKPEDLIWIHDYHLWLVPDFIRKANKTATIAVFSHIPWPPSEVFSTLPWRKEILTGFLGSDLIGFHTNSYVRNFMECVKRELDLEIDESNRIIISDRKIVVKPLPLGIDCKIYSSTNKTIERKTSILRSRIRVPRIIVSLDRLDYTKGILEKVRAFERFLEKYPEYTGKITLIQLVTPTRTKIEAYTKLKRVIDEVVGRINARFSRIDWSPVIYFYRSHTFDEVQAFYKTADVALITPLADGMNLVAKEYVASRDDGILILSEFVGASEELGHAFIVNPYNIEDVADTLMKALTLAPEERKQRFNKLKEIVKNHDIYWWMDTFLNEWKNTIEDWKNIYTEEEQP